MARWRSIRAGSSSKSWGSGPRKTGRLFRCNGTHCLSAIVRTNVCRRVHSKYAGLEVDIPASSTHGSAQPSRGDADERILALAPGLDPLERNRVVLHLVHGRDYVLSVSGRDGDGRDAHVLLPPDPGTCVQ